MKRMERLEAEMEEVLSHWILSASSPAPTAFADPWSPGAGPWRFGGLSVRSSEPACTPIGLKPSTAKPTGPTRLIRVGEST